MLVFLLAISLWWYSTQCFVYYKICEFSLLKNFIFCKLLKIYAKIVFTYIRYGLHLKVSSTKNFANEINMNHGNWSEINRYYICLQITAGDFPQMPILAVIFGSVWLLVTTTLHMTSKHKQFARTTASTYKSRTWMINLPSWSRIY